MTNLFTGLKINVNICEYLHLGYMNVHITDDELKILTSVGWLAFLAWERLERQK